QGSNGAMMIVYRVVFGRKSRFSVEIKGPRSMRDPFGLVQVEFGTSRHALKLGCGFLSSSLKLTL
ncbi:hypothetical protein VII00023_15528, partial [Vibrio ichthyoenteri ATCC 700023]